jgi:hypothetical protein
MRPDLLKKIYLTEEDRKIISELESPSDDEGE